MDKGLSNEAILILDGFDHELLTDENFYFVQWPLWGFTSDKQISPPLSIVCEQNTCISSLCDECSFQNIYHGNSFM